MHTLQAFKVCFPLDFFERVVQHQRVSSLIFDILYSGRDDRGRSSGGGGGVQGVLTPPFCRHVIEN